MLRRQERTGLQALIVSEAGCIVEERYADTYSSTRPHALYSGTKSFWGIAAIEAADEGLFSLDDRVADVIEEFRADARAAITPRMLLQLTAGYGFGGLGSSVPTYEKALATPLKHEPGTKFVYGGIPLQVFGAFFARVLAGRQATPHDYLRERVLQPAGVTVAAWRTLSDGTYPLPTGAQLTARDWLAYGLWVMQRHDRYTQAFRGSRANARYGLGWWLGSGNLPRDVFYASGSGGQALYVVPSRRFVAVRFGRDSGYKHERFLRELLA